MKKWIAAFTIFLSATNSFAAPNNNLNCVGDSENTLDITRDPVLNTVTAVSTSEGIAQVFEGVIQPGGRFEMKPTAANEVVTLALGRQRDHGGRCGRCGGGVSPGNITAQLAVGTAQYVYLCFQNEF